MVSGRSLTYLELGQRNHEPADDGIVTKIPALSILTEIRAFFPTRSTFPPPHIPPNSRAVNNRTRVPGWRLAEAQATLLCVLNQDP